MTEAESYWVCNIGGGSESGIMVGGWGSSAAARAGAWVGGAADGNVRDNRLLLEIMVDDPMEAARGLLERCEGSGVLRTVMESLETAVGQRQALAPARNDTEERETNFDDPQHVRARACTMLTALGKKEEADGLPPVPEEIAALAAAVEATRQTSRLECSALREAAKKCIDAAGAWADEADLFYGKLATAIDAALRS